MRGRMGMFVSPMSSGFSSFMNLCKFLHMNKISFKTHPTSVKYDSIALYYIFHCLPGAFPEKADKVFQTVIPALAPGGVVFGSTVLGKECDHNTLSRTMVMLYNKKGMFGNRDDTEANLRKSLEANFHEYDLRVEGIVALFSARNPKKQKE